MRILIGTVTICIFCVYAPQSGLSDHVKDTFYDELLSHISKVPNDDFVVVAGDLNGHVGNISHGFHDSHGGHGYGARNTEGVRILDFCTAANLAITNTFFVKEDNKLITYQSGNDCSQIDYILVRRSNLKHVRNVKVINGEECAPQHKLLVSDIIIPTEKSKAKTLHKRRRIWKLNQPLCLEQYQSLVQETLGETTISDSVEDAWNTVKTSILNSFDKLCGWSKPGQKPKETWWWNADVDSAIKKKRRLWKAWKKGGSIEEYLDAKRKAKSAVFRAKKEASDQKFSNLDDNDKLSYVFKTARKMKGENQDIVGDKCVKDDDGNIAYDDDSKLKAWRQHYQRLLNVEFDWNEEDLSPVSPVEGPPPIITESMVVSAIKRMKPGKAAGPSGIVAEMVKASGELQTCAK